MYRTEIPTKVCIRAELSAQTQQYLLLVTLKNTKPKLLLSYHITQQNKGE